MLTSVGFSSELQAAPVATLSGGWKMKLALGAMPPCTRVSHACRPLCYQPLADLGVLCSPSACHGIGGVMESVPDGAGRVEVFHAPRSRRDFPETDACMRACAESAMLMRAD